MVSMRSLQDTMRKIYFHKDSKRGVEGTFEWLMEEVDELREAIDRGNKEALRSEFADVVAWLMSLANLLEVDLENALLSKYRECCPKCGSSPCGCAFRISPKKLGGSKALLT
jgi:NTP pyrophosphatase (non-canonical NTP hydrolase)